MEDRQGKLLNTAQITLWLADPLLKLLAGSHYHVMHAHLLGRLKANQAV